MKHDSHTTAQARRRLALSAAIFVAIVAAIAGCTSVPDPATVRAVPSVTSQAATPSRADTVGAPSTADDNSRTAPTADDVPSTTTAHPTQSHTGASRSASAPVPVRAAAKATNALPSSGTNHAAVKSTTSNPRPAARTSTTASRTTSALRPPPTTAVAPPTKGNIHQTVAAVAPVAPQSAALTAEARPDESVAVRVTVVQAVTTVARFPGEIAGPGLAVTLKIDNSGTTAIDLDPTIVDLRGADGERAIAVSGGPFAPLSGELEPGAEATGVYVFTIPVVQRNPITVRFSYSAETPTVVFAGDAR